MTSDAEAAAARIRRYLAAVDSLYDERSPRPSGLAVDRQRDFADPRLGPETNAPLFYADLLAAVDALSPAPSPAPVREATKRAAPVDGEVITVYTDGACSHGGLGGWAWWWGPDPDQHDSGAEHFTTNNAMELWAVIAALEADVDHSPLQIVSDSAYVINGMVDRWYDGWRVNGWRNSKKEPVANRELWEELIALVDAHRAPIEWVHIRGHNKVNSRGERPPPEHVEGNKRADELAVAARLSIAVAHDRRAEGFAVHPIAEAYAARRASREQ